MLCYCYTKRKYRETVFVRKLLGKQMTKSSARAAMVAIACVALCGCDGDKDRTYQACYTKADGDAVQIEICMDEQGYVFNTSHLCSVLYPKVGAECYSTTWRAWDGGGLRCLHPDNSKCGPMSKPYLAVTE